MDRIVNEAIHNPKAIKLLLSGLSTWHICYIYACFYNKTGFVLISFYFCASCLSF